MRLVAFCRLSAALIAITLFTWAGAAAAETTLWDLVGPNVPEDAVGVLYVDGASIKSSALYTQVMASLTTDQREVLDGLKSACNVDPATAVRSALVVMGKNDDSVVYVETSGLDLPQITRCIKEVAKRKHEKVTVSRSGSIVQVSNRNKKHYFGWLNDKVFVLTESSENRKSVVTALAKAEQPFAAKPGVKEALAKVNRAATAWGIAAHIPALPDGTRPSCAYGSVDLAAGNVAVDLRLVCTTAADATAAAQRLNQKLGEASKQVNGMGSVGPSVAKVIKATSVAASGTDVVVRATVAQTDVVNLAKAVK